MIAYLFMFYLLLGLTLMNIGLHPAFDLDRKGREAVAWWAFLWPYMGVRWIVKRIL